MTTNEINWTVWAHHDAKNKIWTSDCGWYRIIQDWFTSTVILEDYTDEKRWEEICEPHMTHVEDVQEGMGIANYRKEKSQ